jgi:hypothetical protein
MRTPRAFVESGRRGGPFTAERIEAQRTQPLPIGRMVRAPTMPFTIQSPGTPSSAAGVGRLRWLIATVAIPRQVSSSLTRVLFPLRQCRHHAEIAIFAARLAEHLEPEILVETDRGGIFGVNEQADDLEPRSMRRRFPQHVTEDLTRVPACFRSRRLPMPGQRNPVVWNDQNRSRFALRWVGGSASAQSQGKQSRPGAHPLVHRARRPFAGSACRRGRRRFPSRSQSSQRLLEPRGCLRR